MTRITIGVTASHHADAHRLLRDEVAAIANRITGRQFAHRNQLAFERHHGLQVQFGGTAHRRERRRPVEHDAGPNPIPDRLRETQQGRRIGQRCRQVAATLHGPKTLQLKLDTARFVGIGKMGHQRDGCNALGGNQPGQCLRDLILIEPEAVHACIQLQVNRQTHRQTGINQRLHLPHRVQHRRQFKLGEQRQFLGLIGAFQHQDGMGNPLLAQRHGAFEFHQGKAVGRFSQSAGRGQQAVTIGIGLDHAPHLRVARMTPHDIVIVAQRRPVQACSYRSRHTAS